MIISFFFNNNHIYYFACLLDSFDNRHDAYLIVYPRSRQPRYQVIILSDESYKMIIYLYTITILQMGKRQVQFEMFCIKLKREYFSRRFICRFLSSDSFVKLLVGIFDISIYTFFVHNIYNKYTYCFYENKA